MSKLKIIIFILIMMGTLGCGNKTLQENKNTDPMESKNDNYTEKELFLGNQLLDCSNHWDPKSDDVFNKNVEFGVLYYQCVDNRNFDLNDSKLIFEKFELKRMGANVDFYKLANKLLNRSSK